MWYRPRCPPPCPMLTHMHDYNICIHVLYKMYTRSICKYVLVYDTHSKKSYLADTQAGSGLLPKLDLPYMCKCFLPKSQPNPNLPNLYVSRQLLSKPPRETKGLQRAVKGQCVCMRVYMYMHYMVYIKRASALKSVYGSYAMYT